MRKFALMFAVLALFAPAPAAAQLDKQDMQVVAELTDWVVKTEKINNDTAEAYALAIVSADRAEAAQLKDKTGSTAFLADYWRKQAMTLLQSGRVVAEGERLIAKIEMSGGTPGARLPEPLEKEARAWIASAVLLGKLSGESLGAATTFAQESALRAPECKEMRMSCGDVLKKAATIVKIAGTSTEMISASAKVLVLSVAKYLTY